ncbi:MULTISPECIES: polysaccharide deacetylase family sporulation protein PdaB [Bacillaceae]|uniref:polysaccharide deacetylase family sporulation protein PdaB n=1 Tax=Bacillaceae TaxID=186817 RepID=UPI001E6019E0|nr:MULTISPECIES: polysaccharide deacetylase family sporulation protein PdaB [Bacillaceae]MCE4051785.1 polysaccharide deacetylase family sporulation protein PdaB [Bacillus sp. Au-Bac7]MCM3034165.1 polysaccharide deacetylase family sporulation protein PdaB [Niallia sp. MER 6]MDL0437155.1 polysaccharide deacetylase family sporulation protein PdaB [Niallia sp. SS-2023]UPO87825.1 polysaccharide deacetylase family sporulation protein PdaB [Niallia sp. Man26]
MNNFYVLNGKRLKQLTLIVVVSFFTAWFLYMENIVQVPVFSSKDGPKAVYKGEKGIALTFNIGWGDEKAEPILDILKKEKVTATFFLAGSWAERHPDLIARIVKEGHEIGILGYDYVDYSDVKEEKINQDVSKAKTAFEKLKVENISLFRAPTGHFDQKALTITNRYNYTLVHWSVDSKDWTNPGTEQIVKNVAPAKKGDIVLLHASDSAKQTANALPAIIDNLKDKNLKFVSVTEMLSNADSSSKEVN